jgi:hypothetical protein
LGNVFYQDSAGELTQEDAFRYTASTNTLAVENITGTTVTGSGVVKGSNTFGQRYATQAATNRAAADTASLTVERYFTVTAEGNGESFNIQSNTPSAGNKIVRKIWYKDEAFEATDVDTWTLLHTFADDTAYASTATKWQEYLDGQANGTPPFTLAISWGDIPAFTGLLDTYGGAAAAYSLRLLDSTYTGDAIRVRRASDNTEQDIGFDVDGDLDTTALTTFCTGTNGFVKTWYDQSGNAKDATQSTTANQPKIYDSSTGVNLTNLLASLNYDGSTDFLKSANFTSLIGAPNFFSAVASFDTTSDMYLVDSDSPGRSATGIIGGNWSIRGLNGGAAATGQHLISVSQESATAYMYVDGVQKISNPSSTLVTHTNVVICDDGLRLDGTLQEFILWNSDQSANRAGIETNINDYYSIY